MRHSSRTLLAGVMPLLVALVDTSYGAPPSQGFASGRVIQATAASLLGSLRTLKPGDTLALAAGDYDESEVPGLSIFGLHGTADAPITITGPRSGRKAVLLGRAETNTVRIADSSYVIVRDLDIDGRNRGGDGVSAQGPSHHITLENLTIRGVGGGQQIVAISTNRAPAWNWTIRGNVIVGAGTGMYLGDSDGTQPFIAGVIEHNLIRDTIGYNLQIKHQVMWPVDPRFRSERTATIIRHNVFAKGPNSSRGRMARPNVLIGDVPPSGPGSANHYEVYGNVFLENPSEALFQGEGNVALYANLFVNRAGPAIVIQPHNGSVRDVQIFGNTIVASGRGVAIKRGKVANVQRADVNVVFADPPIVAPNQLANVVGSYAEAAAHLASPLSPPGTLDLSPRPGALRGPLIDVGEWRSFTAWDLDFEGRPRNWRLRGAYSGEGSQRTWLPQLERKPVPTRSSARAPGSDPTTPTNAQR